MCIVCMYVWFAMHDALVHLAQGMTLCAGADHKVPKAVELE